MQRIFKFWASSFLAFLHYFTCLAFSLRQMLSLCLSLHYQPHHCFMLDSIWPEWKTRMRYWRETKSLSLNRSLFSIANLTALCDVLDDQEIVKPDQILVSFYLYAYSLQSLRYRVEAVIELGVKRERVILSYQMCIVSLYLAAELNPCKILFEFRIFVLVRKAVPNLENKRWLKRAPSAKKLGHSNLHALLFLHKKCIKDFPLSELSVRSTLKHFGSHFLYGSSYVSLMISHSMEEGVSEEELTNVNLKKILSVCHLEMSHTPCKEYVIF